MDALTLVETHRDEVISLCKKFGVLQLRLFGSAITDAWDPERSDIDFLVEYGPEADKLDPLDALVGLRMALCDLLGLQ